MTPVTQLESQDSSLVLSDCKVLSLNPLAQPQLSSGCNCSPVSGFLLDFTEA